MAKKQALQHPYRSKAAMMAKRAGPGPKTPDAADAAVGRRIRAAREKLGLSLKNLAAEIGVTFQQVQKYENNKSRVAMGRLARIAPALGVSTTFLLTGSEEKRGQRGDNEGAAVLNSDGAIRLIKAFDRMKDRNVKHSFLELAETVAKSG